MKLISMTDYVLEQNNKIENRDNIGLAQSHVKIVNYANFLKQPLKLGMFIPCDENDVPLYEPKANNYNMQSDVAYDLFNENTLEYQQAKERVIFDGFELVEIYRYGALLEMNFDDFSEKTTILLEDTIEALPTYSFNPEFELTDSAIKKLNI